MSGGFNVVLWDRDGYWSYAERNVPAKRAVITARLFIACAEKGEAVMQETLRGIDKVQITDAEDYTNLLWERGKGLVFPTAKELREETKP